MEVGRKKRGLEDYIRLAKPGTTHISACCKMGWLGIKSFKIKSSRGEMIARKALRRQHKRECIKGYVSGRPRCYQTEPTFFDSRVSRPKA
jgi:hypothetical protein